MDPGRACPAIARGCQRQHNKQIRVAVVVLPAFLKRHLFMKCAFHHRYMGSRGEGEPAGITLLGCPLDATSTFRGGTKFAPESIRKASWTLETYSPYLKQDLDDVMFFDAGDLELPPGDLEYSLELIGSAVTETMGKGKKILALGGEHLVTYPIVKAMKAYFKEMVIVHFDAHCDLRDEYEGQKLSHATVMKRVKELGVAEILQVGIRSGTRREFEEAAPRRNTGGPRNPSEQAFTRLHKLRHGRL